MNDEKKTDLRKPVMKLEHHWKFRKVEGEVFSIDDEIIGSVDRLQMFDYQRQQLLELLQKAFWIGATSGLQGEYMVDKMVDRFLNWKLPSDFNPDLNNPSPTGTNLFTEPQAGRMVRAMLGMIEPNELE